MIQLLEPYKAIASSMRLPFLYFNRIPVRLVVSESRDNTRHRLNQRVTNPQQCHQGQQQAESERQS
ncbi:hypothetical protein LC593_28850, partial [Nostoc sp. CHAB 5844]|nr:hypothetical protein [Nostoc sp. CHAB 5844]